VVCLLKRNTAVDFKGACDCLLHLHNLNNRGVDLWIVERVAGFRLATIDDDDSIDDDNTIDDDVDYEFSTSTSTSTSTSISASTSTSTTQADIDLVFSVKQSLIMKIFNDDVLNDTLNVFSSQRLQPPISSYVFNSLLATPTSCSATYVEIIKQLQFEFRRFRLPKSLDSVVPPSLLTYQLAVKSCSRAEDVASAMKIYGMAKISPTSPLNNVYDSEIAANVAAASLAEIGITAITAVPAEDAAREALKMYYDYILFRGDFVSVSDSVSDSDSSNTKNDAPKRRPPTRNLVRRMCDALDAVCWSDRHRHRHRHLHTHNETNETKIKVVHKVNSLVESGAELFAELEEAGNNGADFFLPVPDDIDPRSKHIYPSVSSLWLAGGGASGHVNLHGFTVTMGKFAIVYCLREFARGVESEVSEENLDLDEENEEEMIWEEEEENENSLEAIAKKILEIEMWGMKGQDFTIITGKGIHNARRTPTLLLGILAWLLEGDFIDVDEGEGVDDIRVDELNSGRLIITNSCVRRLAGIGDDEENV